MIVSKVSILPHIYERNMRLFFFALNLDVSTHVVDYESLQVDNDPIFNYVYSKPFY